MKAISFVLLCALALTGCGGGVLSPVPAAIIKPVTAPSPTPPVPAPPSTPMPPTPAPVLTSIKVSPTSISIQTGQTTTFTASGFDQNGAPYAVPAFTWNSDDVAVATINAQGVASAYSAGISYITASAAGVTSINSSLIVTAAPPTAPPCVSVLVASFSSSEVIGVESISAGSQGQIYGLAFDQYGNPIDLQFAFTSDNQAVATVDGLSGVISAVAPGTAHIYAGISGSLSGTSSGGAVKGSGVARDTTPAVCSTGVGSPLTITPAILTVTGP